MIYVMRDTVYYFGKTFIYKIMFVSRAGILKMGKKLFQTSRQHISLGYLTFVFSMPVHNCVFNTISTRCELCAKIVKSLGNNFCSFFIFKWFSQVAVKVKIYSTTVKLPFLVMCLPIGKINKIRWQFDIIFVLYEFLSLTTSCVYHIYVVCLKRHCENYKRMLSPIYLHITYHNVH